MNETFKLLKIMPIFAEAIANGLLDKIPFSVTRKVTMKNWRKLTHRFIMWCEETDYYERYPEKRDAHRNVLTKLEEVCAQL